jgi:glycosyltransferase involved in cell wall biosynthesis
MPVGVIVPVRTPAPYLREALDSVLAQDPAPSEVVVVDDASPEPLRLPPAFADACTLVRLPAPAGPGGARAAGLEALSAGLVALLDADDAWEPGKLSAGLEALERHPEAALSFGRATVVDQSGRPTRERWEEPPPGLLEPDALARILYPRNPIPTSSVVLRRAAVEAAGGLGSDLMRAEDWDLWLRFVARGESFVCEPSARVRYRRHPGGLTADVAALAEASLELHERHASLALAGERDGVRAADLTALARGRVRQRSYEEARAALREAAQLDGQRPRERALRAALAVPGLRTMLGRRGPY